MASEMWNNSRSEVQFLRRNVAYSVEELVPFLDTKTAAE
jgi:hypothetical protein